MALIYSLIARNQTVLAEWSDNVGNFATVSRLLLARIAASRPGRKAGCELVTYMYDRRFIFHVLEDYDCLQSAASTVFQENSRGRSVQTKEHPVYRFMVMSEESAGVKLPYKFLEELRSQFVGYFGTEGPLRAIALSYTEKFAPIISETQTRYNEYLKEGIEDPNLNHVRRKIESIHNVMIENIDEIIARSEKIDILVDRADSINSNTLEFRRQAHELHNLMWWRQRKFRVAVSVGLMCVGVLLVDVFVRPLW